MLDSLQLRVKFSLVAILILVLINQVSAYEISANPYEIIIETGPHKEVCRDINVEADSDTLNVHTLWSPTKSRTVETFTLNSEETNIKIAHPTKIAGPRTQFKICIEILDNYSHYGLITIEDPTKHAGLGIWFIINPDNPEKRTLKRTITGNAIKDSQQEQESVDLTVYFMLGTTLLTLALAFLIIKIRKKARP